jgi:hypothetical protein
MDDELTEKEVKWMIAQMPEWAAMDQLGDEIVAELANQGPSHPLKRTHQRAPCEKGASIPKRLSPCPSITYAVAPPGIEPGLS